MSHLARDRGKELERGLFESWGGIPSVSILRHSDSIIPKPAKLRYHGLLAEQTGIAAPSIESEKNNPFAVNEIYRSWSDHLRTQSRDEKKYPLLFKENVNYGFRRNLLGIKWYCVASGVVSLGIIVFPKLPAATFNQIEWSIILLIGLYMLVFILVVSNKWVKTIAVEYAKRLIETLNA